MPTILTPVPITAYPSSIDGRFLFMWRVQFSEAVQDPSELDFQLQIDSNPNFGTVNLRQFYKNSADLTAYHNGNVYKAYEVVMPRRLRESIQTWYWRVRIHTPGEIIPDGDIYEFPNFISEWSDTQTLTILPDYRYTEAQEMLKVLADEHVYAKEASSTLFYELFIALARELDAIKLEYNLTKDDNYLLKIRDTSLHRNFGVLLNLSRGLNEEAVDYRGRVHDTFNAFIHYPGVEQGIIEVVKTFTAEEPTVVDLSTRYGWILGQHYLYDPDYPPESANAVEPVIRLVSRSMRGFGWFCRIYNSWGFAIQQPLINDLIYKIKPAHTNPVIIYETQRNTEALFNNAFDWAKCSLTDLEAVGDVLKIKFDLNKSKLNEECSDFTTNSWSAFGEVNGLMEINPAGQFHLYGATDASSRGYAYTALPGSPTIITADLRIKFDQLPAAPVTGNDHFTLLYFNGITRFQIAFNKQGIHVYDGASYQLQPGTSAYLDEGGSFHDWRFILRGDDWTTATCDIYRDGIKIVNGADCSYSYASTPGRFTVQAIAFTGGKVCEAHIDHIYIDSGDKPYPTEGEAISPVIDATEAINAWGEYSWEGNNNGGTVSIQIRSRKSPSDPWSGEGGFEVVDSGDIPIYTPAQREFQLRIVLIANNLTSPEISAWRCKYKRGS